MSGPTAVRTPLWAFCTATELDQALFGARRAGRAVGGQGRPVTPLRVQRNDGVDTRLDVFAVHVDHAVQGGHSIAGVLPGREHCRLIRRIDVIRPVDVADDSRDQPIVLDPQRDQATSIRRATSTQNR